MAISQIPNLDGASMDQGDTEWVKFGDYEIPRSFQASFQFKDGARHWGSKFLVGVSKHGTPTLLQVTVLGNIDTSTGELITDIPENEYELGGVQRWQLKVIEQYRFQLLEMAIEMALHRHGPRPKPGEPWWSGVGGILNTTELKKINNQIHKRIRQKITPEFLEGVARIYTSAGVRNESPIKAVAERYKCSRRRAQEYATMARDLKLLPPTTQGKVTVRKTKMKRGKDD